MGDTGSVIRLQASGVAELNGPITVGQFAFSAYPSAIQLNGNLTTDSLLYFPANVTLFNNKVNIVSNSHSVGFRNTIDNKPLSTPVGLKVDAGSASVMFDAPIGATSPINTLEVTGSSAVLSGLGGANPGVVDFTEITASGITLNSQTYNAPNQIYYGPVTLGNDITMQSNGIVHFSSSIDGPYALSINAVSNIFLGGNAGSSSALSSLLMSSQNNIQWCGSLYQTLGAQSYSANEGQLIFTLTQNSTTFTSNYGRDIAFFNGTMTLPSSGTVNVSTTRGVTIGPVLGDTSSIVNLQNSGITELNGPITVGQMTFTTPSNIQLNGDLTTYTALDFPANVTLFNSKVNIVSNSNAVEFRNTIDNKPLSTSVGLKVNAGSASVMFDALIGATSPINTLEVTGSSVVLSGLGDAGHSGVNTSTEISASSGGITLNNSFYNAHAQTYQGPVTLGADTTMSSHDGLVTFTTADSTTINGPYSLSVNTGNAGIVLGANVGSSSALTSLSLQNTNTTTGAIQYGGTVYNTVHAQSYSTGIGGELHVPAGIQFNSSSNGDITFSNGTIIPTTSVTISDGAGNISLCAVNGAGGTTFDLNNTGMVTTTGPITIGTLSFITSPSLINLGSSITSLTGAVSMPSPVILFGNAGINTPGTDVTFTGTIDSETALSPKSLTITAGAGSVSFNENIGVSTPLQSLTVTGSTITQQGNVQTTGNVSYVGDATLSGNIASSAGDIQVTQKVVVNASLVTIAGGNVTIGGDVDGSTMDQSLTIQAGAAATIKGVIGGSPSLQNLTINAKTITIHGIGGSDPGVTGITQLTASGIYFTGTKYLANNQNYTAGAFNCQAGTDVLFASYSGPIYFNSGGINLSAGSNLFVTTESSDFSFFSIGGTSGENISINLKNGNAALGKIGTGSSIRSVAVNAGSTTLYGSIASSSLDIESKSNILTSSKKNVIKSSSTILNALGGHVGYKSLPIVFAAPSYVSVGAKTNGKIMSTVKKGVKVHCLKSNPPKKITVIFKKKKKTKVIFCKRLFHSSTESCPECSLRNHVEEFSPQGGAPLR